jgi:hypothetical protein
MVHIKTKKAHKWTETEKDLFFILE